MRNSEETKNTEISVVIPLYNEEGNIEPLYGKLTDVLGKTNRFYEIIFVDDGSQDKAFTILKEINQRDKHVKVIKFSKNFGQSYALIAGIKMAKGEIIVTMDGDLQNRPEDVPKFLAKMEEGFDLVSGWRYKREDSFIRKFLSLIANFIIQKKTGVKIHDYGCAFMAMRKSLKNHLSDYGKEARFIKPLLTKLASYIGEIKVGHTPRTAGISKYNFFKIIEKGIDFILNFNPKAVDKNTLP